MDYGQTKGYTDMICRITYRKTFISLTCVIDIGDKYLFFGRCTV